MILVPGRIRLHIFDLNAQRVGGFNDHFQPVQVEEGLSTPYVNGSASEALDCQNAFLRCFGIHILLIPLGPAGIQTVFASGGTVIIGDQTSRIQTTNGEL